MKFREAVGTVEFYSTAEGHIGAKLIMDIPTNFPEFLGERLRNLQFGVLHMFHTDPERLASTGEIFRNGMDYALSLEDVDEGGGDDGRDNEPPVDPSPTPSDEELMEPVRRLEKFLGKKQ